MSLVPILVVRGPSIKEAVPKYDDDIVNDVSFDYLFFDISN